MKTFKLILITLASAGLAAAAGSSHWVASWGTSPAPPQTEAQMRTSKLMFENQTLREIVHLSLGGSSIRVRLSNAYGTRAIKIGGAHVALRAKDSAIVAGSDRPLLFNGRPFCEIPTNAPALSDPVALNVPAGADLAISIYLPEATGGAGIHYSAMQTNFVGTGDLTGAAAIENAATIGSWVFLTGVSVLAPETASVVVAFGDSITDGALSTADTNRRWPDVLAARLAARKGARIGVVDEGIGGNRVLHDGGDLRYGANALSRFGRDALEQPGVKYIIVIEGINDLGHATPSSPPSEVVTADDVIAGLKQMVERAHEHGIKIFGGTLTPFAGMKPGNYFSPEKEVKRKAINEWIRTSGAFDGVIDFEKTVRDPARPDVILKAYDSGDGLHPGDAGYKAMGEAIDLGLFR